MNTKIYEIVTDKIIELLKKGTVPWHQPWNITKDMPTNLISKKPYRGINVWMLFGAGYQSPYWLTYKQVSDLGGYVKKGEKSTIVVYYQTLKVENKDNPDDTKKIPLLRYYHVFNLQQCEGINEAKIPHVEIKEIGTHVDCENIVDGMPNRPEVKFGFSKASYQPSTDLVRMPNSNTFESQAGYYSTYFHELAHSTGHNKRLNRKEIMDFKHFGTDPYAREELVAEMTSSFLCGVAGIENQTIDNSAAYINSWMKRLKDDCLLIVQAASAAQKAADYILGKKPSDNLNGNH